MWKRIKEWWHAEGDLAQLQGVSDRMLEDMGLEREGLRARVLGRANHPSGTAAVADRKGQPGLRAENLACAKPC